MSDITKDQVVEWLSSQSVIEVADLVKELEEKWGVSAAAPAAVAVAAPAGFSCSDAGRIAAGSGGSALAGAGPFAGNGFDLARQRAASRFRSAHLAAAARLAGKSPGPSALAGGDRCVLRHEPVAGAAAFSPAHRPAATSMADPAAPAAGIAAGAGRTAPERDRAAPGFL